MNPARTRFAPSPTGRTHLGNLRTALFDWCLSRRTAGQFILRLEDTDQKRLVEGGQAELQDSMRWLGLTWDEGPDVGGPYAPYVQSARLEKYRQAAQYLIENGAAYFCDCTPKRLENLRQEQLANGEQPRYDNCCRDRQIENGPNTVVRFRLHEGTTLAQDALRGPVEFDGNGMGDPVIINSDGFPTYHLASVVDDHEMQITHVLRGDEWLSSTPIHVQLYEAFGWELPVFVHLPLMVDQEGRKIKKRGEDDDGASEDDLEYTELLRVSNLRERGYLPSAVFNYLAFLGWHPGTTDEILMPNEIVEAFSLERLSTSPSTFDVERLNWFNQQHLKRLSIQQLVVMVLPRLLRTYPDYPQLMVPHWTTLLLDSIRDELVTLSDILPATRFAFADPESYTPEALAELQGETGAPVLAALRDELPPEGKIDLDAAEDLLKELRKIFKQSHEWGGQQVMLPLRAALTGSTEGPHLANIIALLDAETCHRRIERALAQVGQV